VKALLSCVILIWSIAVASGQTRYIETNPHNIGLTNLGVHNTCFVDLNDDGLIDIWTGWMAYINEGAGQYKPRRDYSIMTRFTAFGDYDNDGFVDGISLEVDQINIFKNTGPPDFDFIQMDSIAGLGYKIENRQLADIAWLDFNQDGYLDFYVSSYEYPPENSAIGHPDYLFINNTDGSFSDFSAESLIDQEAKCSRGISILDYNNDGLADIYVSNYRLEDNVLWENQGDSSFVNIAKETGVSGNRIRLNYGHNIGTAVGDLDGNACLDLFTPITHHSGAPGDQRNHLWLNTCGPDFEYFDFLYQSTHDAEIGSSPLLFDYDNDADLDIFYINLYGKPGPRVFLYENDGGVFTDVTTSSGLTENQSCEFAQVCDINMDGILDLYNPRLYGGNEILNHIFIGQKTNENKAVTFTFKGDPSTGSNSTAIGTRAYLWTDGQLQMRELYHNCGNSYGSMMQYFMHFGVAEKTMVDSIQVHWPSGAIEHFYELESEQHYHFKEGQNYISKPY